MDLLILFYFSCIGIAMMRTPDYIWIGGFDMEENHSINTFIHYILVFIPLVNAYLAYLSLSNYFKDAGIY